MSAVRSVTVPAFSPYIYNNLFSTDDFVSVMLDCYVQTMNRFFDPSSHLTDNSLHYRDERINVRTACNVPLISSEFNPI